MTLRRRSPVLRLAALIVAVVRGAGHAALVRPAAGADLGQLSSQLSAQQARQQALSASVGRLSGLIASLTSQISLVQSREAAVRAELAHDRPCWPRRRRRCAESGHGWRCCARGWPAPG